MPVYRREDAVAYAREWAFRRNPLYLDFELIGGDCTNYASQCLYAGCPEMNYEPVIGWYYVSPEQRAPAWTSVEALYSFLTRPHTVGPAAYPVERGGARPGDLVQLGRADGTYFHTPVIVAVTPREVYVAAHSEDAWMRPLSAYPAERIRFLHVVGSGD
ncbi:MAG TPA: amidase domain-containing protein [Clostridia bacterium]|nr:amidase domain-containing protein [Clostridia bacterium]